MKQKIHDLRFELFSPRGGVTDHDIPTWKRLDELWKEHKKSDSELDEINKKLNIVWNKVHQDAVNHEGQEGGRKRTRRLKKRGKKTRKH